MDVIVKMIFGSHLYGTNNEHSDTDYKGIYMPTERDILLNRVGKSITNNTKSGSVGKNTADDVDCEMYSLHYFLKLACEGQTVALDMLHAPENMIVESSPTWNELVSQREMFYTKNLTAFVGYARRQAAKYGIKGSRLNTAEEVLKFLRCVDVDDRLRDIWDCFIPGDHIHVTEPTPQGIKQIQVCGKIFQETMKVGYVIPILTEFCNVYGARARDAAENKGIDWKAISHALRAAYQVRELLTHKTITFPLNDARFLRTVKEGKLDYVTVVSPILEALMDEVEALSLISDLPSKVNRKSVDDWLISILRESVVKV